MKTLNNSFLELFVRELQIRNFSPRTIQTYTELLQLLSRDTGLPLENITVNDFKEYLRNRIMVDRVSASTVNQIISAFKHLQTEVLNRKWEDFKIQRPRRPKKLPEILSKQEVQQLLSTPKNIKHKTILVLGYACGLRKMEVLNLKPGDIDSGQMRIRVRQGKGKKDRFTLLSEKTLHLLREYYKLYRPKTYLFEPQGNPGNRLSEGSITAMIKRSAKDSRIKKRISFHTLRHCFATHLLENGANIKLIQQLLGHRSLKTTMLYLHLADTRATSIVSPVEDFNI